MTRLPLLAAVIVLAVLVAAGGEVTADGAGAVDVPIRCGTMERVVYCVWR